MGTMYINGKPFILDTENQSATLQFCDQCEKWQSITGGRMIYGAGATELDQGEALLWICRECRS